MWLPGCGCLPAPPVKNNTVSVEVIGHGAGRHGLKLAANVIANEKEVEILGSMQIESIKTNQLT
jgi:hypothetical protein